VSERVKRDDVRQAIQQLLDRDDVAAVIGVAAWVVEQVRAERERQPR